MAKTATGARRVFVFGSANHDHVLRVSEFPRAGETVLSHEYTSGLGGKGANQAVAAARAGASVVFVGTVGADQQGSDVVANFADHGIDHRFLTRLDAPTGLAIVLVDAHGSNEIIVAPGANAALSEDAVAAAIAVVDEHDIIVIQCEIPPSRLEQVVQYGARRGATVVLNLAPFTTLDPAVFAGVGLLVVNESEARSLLRADLPAGELAAGIATSIGCACIVTLGEAGSSYARPGADVVQVAATDVDDVVDTTGAGDVYVGTLAAVLAHQDDVVTAMQVASRAAAESVSSPGAQARRPQPANAVT